MPGFRTAYKSSLLSQLLHIECLLYAKHSVSNFCTWSSSFVGSQSKVSALMLKELLITYISCHSLGLPVCRWQVLNIQLMEERKKSKSEVTQSCLTLCDPRDSSLHQAPPSMGFSYARVLEWVAISFSRESSQCRDRTQVSHIVDRRFTIWATREVIDTGGEPHRGLPSLWNLVNSLQILIVVIVASLSCDSDSLQPHGKWPQGLNSPKSHLTL